MHRKIPGTITLVGLCLALSGHAQAQGTAACDPYKDYSCLDSYLGNDVLTRFFNYCRLEWGHEAGPADPNAPEGHRKNWAASPQAIPPMPFTDWPYGGTTPLGDTRTGSVDSPLMAAIANTGFGKFLNTYGIQIYGWVDPGFNFSSNNQRKGGNFPVAYAYDPNNIQLDQVVLYIDRFPDTVQRDHIDWGFRISGIYGENYRYTTSYGLASYQLLKYNSMNGYDFPMLYGELFIPQVAEGLMLRLGRYISLPDIEAQLAPNNYMYTHSMTYAYDNYTNEGLQASLAVTPHFIVQFGINVGTETTPTNLSKTLINPAPNPLYPSPTFMKDPGAHVPSFTVCLRYEWNNAWDDIQGCANGINGGTWGYNNLQWYGLTYYHKWNDHWHISFEFYHEHEDGVPNINNPTVAGNLASGAWATPFSIINANAPNMARCQSYTALRCTAYAMGAVAYLNYSPNPLDNFSLRPEIYYDPQGQRTGTAATYWEVSVGWQHWFSPQVEVRPEVGYYRSNGASAFNNGRSNHTLIAAGDLIWHF